MSKCPKCGFVQVTRSLAQNKTYWGLCIEPMAQEAGCSAMEMHEILKDELLSKEIPVKTKDGIEFRKVGGSTTQMSTKEFKDYMERVKEIAARVYGVICLDPHQFDPAGEY